MFGDNLPFEGSRFDLSPDFRCSPIDHTDDTTWRLNLGGSLVPALQVETTFGLRAFWLRIFPRFVTEGAIWTNPQGFTQPPRQLAAYPNYYALRCMPLPGIECTLEYWTPENRVLVCRYKLANQEKYPQSLRLEWVMDLNPLPGGVRSNVTRMGINTVLAGQTRDLFPVLFCTGGPETSAGTPANLSLPFDLQPQAFRTLTWALAAAASPDQSLDQARRTAAIPWEPEIARLEVLNSRDTMEITTGNPDWDNIFAETQREMLRLCLPGVRHFHNPVFILRRSQDQGFSLRGNGSDFNADRSGYTLLDAWWLSRTLGATSPALVRGWLADLCSLHTMDGSVDWKPGFFGQRTQHLAYPLLATLARENNQRAPDSDLLVKTYTVALDTLAAWMKTACPGGVGWSHPLQSGLPASPMFSLLKGSGQGVAASCLSSPGLAALLFQECQQLIEIAAELNRPEEEGLVRSWQSQLNAILTSSYSPDESRFFYRDIASGAAASTSLRIEKQGAGKYRIRRKFAAPTRLQVRVHTRHSINPLASIQFMGTSPDGPALERIANSALVSEESWIAGTSRQLYSTLEWVEVKGIGDQDEVLITAIDYQIEDLSLYLPLWTGWLPNGEGRKVILQHLIPKYLHPFGFSWYPHENALVNSHPCASMLWNQIGGEILLRYGFEQETRRLVEGVLRAILIARRHGQSPGEQYDPFNGEGGSLETHLYGLAPLGLFLRTLGIRQLDEKKIMIQGLQPYDQDVRIRFRDFWMLFQNEKTVLASAAGWKTEITDRSCYQINFQS